jgi:hypothetical protein
MKKINMKKEFEKAIFDIKLLIEKEENHNLELKNKNAPDTMIQKSDLYLKYFQDTLIEYTEYKDSMFK